MENIFFIAYSLKEAEQFCKELDIEWGKINMILEPKQTQELRGEKLYITPIGRYKKDSLKIREAAEIYGMELIFLKNKKEVKLKYYWEKQKEKKNENKIYRD